MNLTKGTIWKVKKIYLLQSTVRSNSHPTITKQMYGVLEGDGDQQKNTLDIWAPLAKPFMFLERLRSPSLIETDNITEPLWDKWKCFSLPRKKQQQQKTAMAARTHGPTQKQPYQSLFTTTI